MKAVLPSPGSWGVNEQEQDQLLNPSWATVADGLVLNESGRLACRGGLVLTSSDGAPAEILRQFVYVDAAGTEIVISTTATKIISGVGDLDDASTDVTPAGAPTNGFWQFVNFNGKVLGWQAGHTPIVKTSGDFATITAASGTLPDGDCVCAAFGRVWAVDDDGQTIRISALLDETKWDAADGGASIDMRNVWTKGMDRVTAIAAFGSNLIVFGRRHIVTYTDGSGSTLGLNPEQMYVVDTVEGTGCVARDSIASVGEGDLIFLSEAGLQSFGRVLQSKDNPLTTISWQINDRLTTAIKSEVVSATDLRTWTGAYIPHLKSYMLVHTTNEDVYVFHTDATTQDDKGRPVMPVTIWDTSILTNIRGFITLRSGVTYTTGGSTHEIYRYDSTAATDASSAAIAVNFESGWIDFGDAQLKVLKTLEMTFLNPGARNSAITAKYAADYDTTLTELAYRARSESRIINLYDVFGDDTEGQYFKIGFEDADFGRKKFQHIAIHYKSGRTGFIHKNFSDAVTIADAELFVICGSSNARSFSSTVAGLPANLTGELTGAKIWDIDNSQWLTYEATENSDLYNSDDAWGPEAEFARQYLIANPTKTIYMVKIALDSSSMSAIASGNTGAWEPSANELFDEMTAAVAAAKANLIASGLTPLLKGVVIFVGGVDALTQAAANAYESAMTSFISEVRVSWGDHATKVIIPRILDSRTFSDTIREATEDIATADSLVEWYDTDFYPLSADEDHYEPAGIVALGHDAFQSYNDTYPGLDALSSPTFANVKLLAGFDGADGATSYTSEDAGARTATFVGNAQLDTDATKLVYGTACALFDGTGDAITFPDSVDFSLGNGPFVIQFTVRFSSASGLTAFINQWNSGTNQRSFAIDRAASGDAIQFSYSTNGTLTTSALAPDYNWFADRVYRVMVERDASNDVRIFINGILVGKANIGTDSFHNSTEALRLGALTGFADRDLEGILDEVRIVKGEAIHSSDDRFLYDSAKFARS